MTMQYEMRRSDRGISEEEALELLRTGEYGILSTVDEDGTPYGVPLSYGFDGERIYFHGTPEGGRKMDNVLRDTRACFTVVGDTEILAEKFSTVYHSVIAEGHVRLLSEEADKRYGLSQLIDKYSSDFAEKGAQYIDKAVGRTAVYEMTVETLSGKARKH